MSSPPEIEAFFSHLEERVAPAERSYKEAWWRLATTGSAEARDDLVRAGIAFNRLFADRAEHEKVRGWHEKRDLMGSSLLRRQVEVVYRLFAAHAGDEATVQRIEELEAEANAIYGNHRGSVAGREVGENEVREILRTSEDEALRREAWEASKTVGRKVEGIVRELARLRNRLAREGGYPDHYRRSLDLQDIEADELDGIMSHLETATDAPFASFKRDLDARLRSRFDIETLMPWHLSDPFFQEPPEDLSLDVDRFFREEDLEALTRRTYDNMGLEVRDVLARSDLYEREGKSQHAFCLPVGREYPYDVRVLANVRPDAYWMDTMLHEFGHAVYDKHVNPGLPYFLRSCAHTSTTEAIALMMGSLAGDPTWLSAVAGVPEDTLREDRQRLLRIARADRLVFVRWALVMFHFERALYEDPDREDLNSLWWDLVERLQLVKRPPGRDEPDWAAKIHIAVAPVYYHNYVLGHLIAAQLRRHLEERVTGGPFFVSEVAGRYLQEAVFGPGARNGWRDTILGATGEKLNPDHFVSTLR
ncbi:MAG TPA: M2 family metallopeptidase [Rubrobacteraceae bacterium]|nr:M2 family metallopeptidase [Rubrobacteraceae bacterium]